MSCHVSWKPAEGMRLQGQIQGTLLLTALQTMWNSFLHPFRSPRSPGPREWWGPTEVDAVSSAGLSHSWETLRLEIQISDQANLPQLRPKGKHYLFPTGQETTVPSARGRHSLSSNVLCFTKLLEKIVWKESCSSGPLFPRPAKPEDTRETCPQQWQMGDKAKAGIT